MSNASYLKLKEKIAKLEKDINTLVFHPESYEANLIRARKGFVRDGANAILYGSRNGKGNGILDAFQTPKESIEAFTQ